MFISIKYINIIVHKVYKGNNIKLKKRLGVKNIKMIIIIINLYGSLKSSMKAHKK